MQNEPESAERLAALVGRPNVGKSALFNRLARRRIAIVHDQPGVTRDRIVATCRLGNAPFDVVDTGGIGSAPDHDFAQQIRNEAEMAITSAGVIILVVDGREGLTPLDEELANLIRGSRRPLLLAVNKIDLPQHEPRAAEFSRLGLPALAISAEHGRGIEELVGEIDARLPHGREAGRDFEEESAPIKIAVVGRPNAGKSSLINSILADRRTIVSEIAGTTRDAVDIPYSRRGQRYVLIDTAGLRPRRRQDSSVEVFSAMRSEKSIRRADLCVLVLDGELGLTAQDKKIANLIQKARKPCIVVFNKWDLIKEELHHQGVDRKTFLSQLRSRLFFIDYAPILLISARSGEETGRVMRAVERLRSEARRRFSTPELTRLLRATVEAQPPPMKRKRRFKILYATQPAWDPRRPLAPPELILFVNDRSLLTPNYRKFLETKIRGKIPYEGLPLLLDLRQR